MSKRKTLTILILQLLCLQTIQICKSEKILFFFGGGSFSMKNSAWPWAVELAEKHQVTFLSAHDKSPTKSSKVRDISTPTMKEILEASYGIDRFQQRQKSGASSADLLNNYSKMSCSICEKIFLKSENDTVLNQILNETFDLVVVNVIFGECGFVIAAKNNAKTITFSGTIVLPWMFDVYGFQESSSWVPDILFGAPANSKFPLTFYDRFCNALWPLYWYYDRQYVLYPGMEKVMKTVFKTDDVPSFYELERNTSLVVINSHPATDFAYALPPFIIQIGGIQTFQPEKKIPEKYQKFMDEAETGVVLISFGSTIPLEKVPRYYSEIFFGLVKKHKNIRFLIKWNGPLLEGCEGLHNLMATDWLPQAQILNHPKMVAFLSHGGLNSVQESTFSGVPLIVLPLFADQDYNAYRVDAQKVGIRLEVRDLTFDIMDKALEEIINDPKYKQNMKVKSRIFKDRPQDPKNTLVYWTEFVLRHEAEGLSSLKPMNFHLSWYQRRLLDVYIVYSLILGTSILLCCYVIFKVAKKLIFTKPIQSKKKIS